jgi:nicotinamidase-related amidase
LNTREIFDSVARRPAVVTVDLHRGHLDPTIATLPLSVTAASALVGRIDLLLRKYRELHVPVIHILTSYGTANEIVSNPFWRIQTGVSSSPRSRIAEHNLVGGPGVEIMPGIIANGDLVVDTKKRYDSFFATPLEFLLRTGGHDSILLIGVNTNSCVLATGIAACTRDFAVFLVDDGIDTMMGAALDAAARAIFEASFGWVITGADSIAVLRSRTTDVVRTGSLETLG